MLLRSLLAYPLMRLQMFRVGLGFTVHSPFGYYFIRCVLRERLPFYCFRSEVTGRADRRLFRVLNYFRPDSICYSGRSARAREIARIVCPGAAECTDPAKADFTYVGEEGVSPAEFNVLYAERAADIPPRAMIFSNGCTMIAVRRQSLPAQTFRLRF